jgi:glycosyltransferase involved in cell wall biosynthesis
MCSDGPHRAVSIILPTYNRLKYLRESVDSVFAQSFTDWELIIADDGSGPETRAYLGGLAEKPRVKVIYLPHTGNPGAVRNIAIRSSRSDYLAFMDSDDLWLPTKLAAQVAAHQTNRSRRWSYTGVLRIDAEGRTMPVESPGRPVVHAGSIFPQLLTFEAAVGIPTVLAERSFVEELGGFDEAQSFYEDYDLWLRMSLRSEVSVITEQLVKIRSHAEHYSGDRARVYESRIRLLNKVATEMATTADHRAIVRTERVKNALALSRVHVVAGRRKEALRMLWRARGGAARRFNWWPEAAMIVVRAIAPSKVLDTLRVLRCWVRGSNPR